MDAAWWRVQEIERRLRDAGHSVDVERAKLRSMLGEVRELWRRVADSEVEVDRALAGPISRDVYADYIIAGGANPSDYPIKDVQVTTYFADGVVADSQLTDIDGHVDIMTPVSGGTIKYECPRYETINATIGSPPDDVEISMEPATGYRALNANAATLWATHWEAWKDTIVVTDSIRGSGNIGSSDETSIGTFTGSAVTYKVILSGGVPAVQIRWFFGSSFVTYDFTYPLAGDITASIPTLTGDSRASRFKMEKTRTLSFVNNNPWASAGVSFSLTLKVEEAT
jgi:hypothetical protein